ncbi:MAG: hypothetical protein O2894_00480 [Planctomycetota bacterium]|nr:hypothetical protein [Planctomycetota bacterium]
MRTLRTLGLLLGAGLALTVATPVHAGVVLGVGDRAADFEGKEFVNSEPVDLKSLRGRIVFIELFSTG